ncbi:methylated-DNA--[protein]-cysteine S-methyltransferase [Campylobacter ureolyticus]|uniref:methylated-DNA--[protein]-cysteine S-methyltransferase n=1 Tax=Campylobacter ureolyticus TaxID=827 RepID=UPI0022B4BFFD|nr:methylated-DNA--[protein]-cysteine S-methyltransferase [Campylobacter ureolyticus]MCZ6105546.1 methylated-DNA--[protein]-cysteine S-methyltransferase [Campylobacter ureolyticus]MCZ6110995.1 methylated-DNA--[protein]-cysteine S-methyltransferase [Campylobacter ureolyticus]
MQKVYFKAGFINLEIYGDENGISEIKFVDFYKNLLTNDENLKLCIDELNRYFKGDLKSFSVKLNITGTKFEKDVYSALLKIPYGEVRTYKEIAESINHPKAYRAVGNANSKNKIPIIVPCHRVVSNSGIGGYTGGINIKKNLLKIEKYL